MNAAPLLCFLFGCSLAVDAGGLSELELDAGSVQVAHDVSKGDAARPELERDAGHVLEPDAGPELELDAGELEHDAGPELELCRAGVFSAEASYAAGDQVQAGGVLYECRPLPASNWCSLDSYEPGVGPFWGDAWLSVRNCPPR